MSFHRALQGRGATIFRAWSDGFGSGIIAGRAYPSQDRLIGYKLAASSPGLKISPVGRDNLNFTDDLFIELGQFPRRNPVLTVNRITHLPHRVSTQKITLHLKPQHVSHET